MYIILTILITVVIIEIFFKNTNVYKNLFNHISETFNNPKIKTIINRGNDTIYNDSNFENNQSNSENIKIKINLKGDNNDFNLESKTKDIINSMKDTDFKKIITDLTGFIKDKTMGPINNGNLEPNSQEYKDYIDYLSKMKYEPVIKKKCEQTIIDVSYPKMYFRNDYNIKKNRLKFTDY